MLYPVRQPRIQSQAGDGRLSQDFSVSNPQLGVPLCGSYLASLFVTNCLIRGSLRTFGGFFGRVLWARGRLGAGRVFSLPKRVCEAQRKFQIHP